MGLKGRSLVHVPPVFPRSCSVASGRRSCPQPLAFTRPSVPAVRRLRMEPRETLPRYKRRISTRLNRTVPAMYCNAMGPDANFASSPCAVTVPLSRTVKLGPFAVIS